MPPKVVVLGAGYAGTSAVRALEDELDGASLTWIADRDYHFVLHESHRLIRDPTVREKLTVPVREIAARDTKFVQAEVVGVDAAERHVELADGSTVDYDYLLVAVGSRTAFFGIDGLAEHAHTLKSLEDALGIHEALEATAARATEDEPASVVVGGAGLSGIQSAGEIAAFREARDVPMTVHLVEGLDSVFPPGDPAVQRRLHDLLVESDVHVHTGEFVGEVDADTVYVGEDAELNYDVLLWTGGITGREAVAESDVETDERSRRVTVGADFQASDDRVFAVGDTALVDQGDAEVAPPTAVAAWDAGVAAGENVARAVAGRPLREWTYEDKGTLVSVGDEAVAHDVRLPGGISVPVSTFGGAPAEFLKKAAAARWLASVAGAGHAFSAWDAL